MEPNKIKKEIIDYDVEFYKIGQSCNGLKKRHAIIKPIIFFNNSSFRIFKIRRQKQSKIKGKNKIFR